MPTTGSSITLADLQFISNDLHVVSNDLHSLYGLLLFLTCYLVLRDCIKFLKFWMFGGMY